MINFLFYFGATAVVEKDERQLCEQGTGADSVGDVINRPDIGEVVQSSYKWR